MNAALGVLINLFFLASVRIAGSSIASLTPHQTQSLGHSTQTAFLQ